jgi:hypothetical protein
MKIPNLIRVRGIDANGIIRQSRVFAQRAAAMRFVEYLDAHDYVVRVETANNVEFQLVDRLV